MMNLYDNKNFIPMLLSEVSEPFDDADYLFELKFDGIRALIYVEPKQILIKSRRGSILNDAFPELLKIKKLVKKPVIFDGEIIIMDNDKPSFNKLQLRSRLQDKNKIANYVKTMPVVFVAFDILYEGENLIDLPLLIRKQRLAQYTDNPLFVKAKWLETKGISLYNTARKADIEGIISKKSDSLYQINKRTKEWLKIKHLKVDNFYICGYKEEKDNASLLLTELKNNQYLYVGKVSIRLNNPEYLKIKNGLKTKKPIFEKTGFNYLKPNLICRIEFLERTRIGGLRHPIYRGLVF